MQKIILIGLMALFAVGCSDDDGNDGGDAPTSPSEPTEPSSPIDSLDPDFVETARNLGYADYDIEFICSAPDSTTEFECYVDDSNYAIVEYIPEIREFENGDGYDYKELKPVRPLTRMNLSTSDINLFAWSEVTDGEEWVVYGHEPSRYYELPKIHSATDNSVFDYIENNTPQLIELNNGYRNELQINITNDEVTYDDMMFYLTQELRVIWYFEQINTTNGLEDDEVYYSYENADLTREETSRVRKVVLHSWN